jgi:hypothetical protein
MYGSRNDGRTENDSPVTFRRMRRRRTPARVEVRASLRR